MHRQESTMHLLVWCRKSYFYMSSCRYFSKFSWNSQCQCGSWRVFDVAVGVFLMWQLARLFPVEFAVYSILWAKCSYRTNYYTVWALVGKVPGCDNDHFERRLAHMLGIDFRCKFINGFCTFLYQSFASKFYFRQPIFAIS